MEVDVNVNVRWEYDREEKDTKEDEQKETSKFLHQAQGSAHHISISALLAACHRPLTGLHICMIVAFMCLHMFEDVAWRVGMGLCPVGVT